MPRKDLGSYKYQQLRAAFLADKSQCHWCRRHFERLTVDHVIPVALMHLDSGLTPLDTENWVPACLPCNAKRGARLGQQLRPRKPRRPRRPELGFEPSREW